MSVQTMQGQRPLPQDTDYVGKGRVAACCARRRYNLRPDADEMNELINHAASVYWHYLERQQAHPARAFVAARDRSATYYFRKMRGGKLAYLKEVRIVNLEDPICDFQRNCRMTAVSIVTVEKVSGDVYSFPS